MIEVGECPLCGSREHEFFESYRDNQQELRYELCTRCGLIFQSPRMSEGELAQFYTGGYRQRVQGSEEPTEKDLRIQAGRARTLLHFLKGRVDDIDRHLDIGASSGVLLRIFQGRLDCEGVGVEPGDAYRQLGEASGLAFYTGLSDLPEAFRGAFDLVTMSHVLEHLPDPVKTLRDIRERWSTKDGYLLLEVPNGFGHQSMELGHLFVFTPRTLRKALHKSGFRVLKLSTHGKPRSPLLRLYITVLAQAGTLESNLELGAAPEWIRFRRRTGMLLYERLTQWLPNLTWRPLPEGEEVWRVESHDERPNRSGG